MSLEAKLGLDVFKLDKESHISINHEICRTLCKAKYCLFVCPAKVYTLSKDGTIHAKFEGCLECGTCVLACEERALKWHYPKGGFGVQYRFG